METSWRFLLFTASLLACNVGLSRAIRRDERWLRMLSFAGCQNAPTQPITVFLTVSSLAKTKSDQVIDRLLELNWYGDKMQRNDKVALYDHDPTNSIKDPLVVVSVRDNPDGYYRSSVHFPYINFAKNNLTTKCLGYWIGYLSNGQLITSSCLRAQPFWMKSNNKFIEKLRLREIMIPGTHDSGSYKRYNSNSSADVVVSYTINQEENIFNQLAYGIRSFDLRIGFYDDTPEKFWVNHRYFNINHTLLTVLKDVQAFMDSTEEIVILDFHNFPFGFDPDRLVEIHRMLRKLIKSVLEPHMLPYKYGYDVTLGDIWASKRRLIVAYNSDKTENDPLLWRKVLQMWGDKRSPESLKDYFMDVFSKDNPMTLWSAMAEMTPSVPYIVIHPIKGLRGMADDINRNVTQWFRFLWWRQANIVATDFFLGNDMINVAIEANKKKMLCLNKSLPVLLRM